MYGKHEAVAVPACFEEDPLGEASPVENVEISEWVFDGLRSHRMYRRDTVLGFGIAICLHAVVPAMMVLFAFMFAVPSVSEPPFVTVSLVSLAGAGGVPGSPGSGAAVCAGKDVSRNPVKTAAVKRKARTRPRKAFARRANPVEHLLTRRPAGKRRRPEKAAGARASTVVPTSVPLHGTVSAPGNDLLPGLGSRGTPGGGTGAGGLDLKQVDTPPDPIKKVEPEFPDEARQMGISGRVVLKFLVKADGRVARASVISARPEGVFDQSALEAIREWRFKPGLYKGKPVAVWVELPVRFRLSR